MPHELEVLSDGSASMVSAIEIPWHRLGYVADHLLTVEEALVLSRADYEVLERPVYVHLTNPFEGGLNYIPIPNKKATVREDPERPGNFIPLGVVGEDYTIVQNRDAFAFLDELPRLHPEIVDPSQPLIETMGVLFGGRRAFACLRLPRDIVVDAPSGDTAGLYVGILTSHDGSLALTGAVSPVRWVCHEEGTMIDDQGWRGRVESHPSARVPQVRRGISVRVWGLPFSERVTSEHRYYARQVTRRPSKRGPRVRIVSELSEPGWVKAQDLRFTPSRGHTNMTYHEIGLPIDTTEKPAPAIERLRKSGRSYLHYMDRDSRLDDPEWWWALGYWWGNGNLHYGRGLPAGLCFSVREDDFETLDRLTRLLRSAGWKGKPKQRQGCVQIVFSDRVFAMMVEAWYEEGVEAWSHKVPPAWVETLPLHLQRALVRGYFDADGDHKTKDGAIIGSVCLSGLLSLRRILARLGIPSAIRDGNKNPSPTILGRKVRVQRSYTIRFWKGIEQQLGLSSRHHGYTIPYIEDGVLWSRVKSVEEVEELKVWPIETETGDYLTAFGRSHNCNNTVTMGLKRAVRTWKLYHTRNIKGRMEEARKTLQLSYAYADEFEREARELLAVPMTIDQQADVMSLVFPLDSSATDRQRANVEYKIDQILTLTASDPAQGTAWGLYNGFVEYIDFHRPVRTTSSHTEAMDAKAMSLSWGFLAEKKATAYTIIREAALALA